MVLHIAVEGVDGVGKTTQIKRLYDYFTKEDKHHYKVRIAVQPVCEEVIQILDKYNLTSHEIGLLMAFDRSLSYYGENWDEYDLVLWDRSVLSSYAYNTDKKTPATFIKQINKYFPEMNLYIIIKTEKTIAEQDYTSTSNLIKKYNNLLKSHKNTYSVDYIENEEEKVTENIVKLIYDKLPRCSWCGRLFTPSKHYKKYCKDDCKKYSLEDQHRVNNLNHYHKYKNVMSERQKGGLGSKGANLHGTADPNPFAELEKIRRAKRSLGL